jgi:hypothetical protein
MFRSIRLDHTNCLQVAIKTQSHVVFVLTVYPTCGVRSYTVPLMPPSGPVFKREKKIPIFSQKKWTSVKKNQKKSSCQP